MKKLLKFSVLPLLVILLTFIQVSAEEDILLELNVGEGDLLMYFVDGDDGDAYISEPSAISFETSNTSFDPVDVEGTFGVSDQQLRIDNATGSEVELAVALDVSDFENDAKWDDGSNTFLAYSTDGSEGGLLVDPESIVLTDDGCGGVTSDRTSDRFTYLGSGDAGNVESVDVLNTTGSNECRFDLTNLVLTQTIPPRTPQGTYSLGMVLTLTAGGTGGDWYIPEYTLTYTAGANGSIIGDSPQTVSYGSDGTTVEADPDSGYMFVDWSDSATDNPRTDTNVTGDISITANFAEEDCSTMAIGDECGGGVVAYHDGSGGGLIAATEDQSAGIQWGCKGTLVGTSDNYGEGEANTDAIIAFHEGWEDPWDTGPDGETCDSANDGTVAARLCYDLDIGDYEDWFLPSRDELTELYNNHVAIGNFNTSGDYYWSSSEGSSLTARARRFSDGIELNRTRHKTGRVRCVRAF